MCAEVRPRADYECRLWGRGSRARDDRRCGRGVGIFDCFVGHVEERAVEMFGIIGMGNVMATKES